MLRVYPSTNPPLLFCQAAMLAHLVLKQEDDIMSQAMFKHFRPALCMLVSWSLPQPHAYFRGEKRKSSLLFSYIFWGIIVRIPVAVFARFVLTVFHYFRLPFLHHGVTIPCDVMYLPAMYYYHVLYFFKNFLHFLYVRSITRYED